MSKAEYDLKRWGKSTPDLTADGWKRYAIPLGQNEWDVLPNEVDEECNRPLLIEWRPSTMGGWGRAAVWTGPVEDD